MKYAVLSVVFALSFVLLLTTYPATADGSKRIEDFTTTAYKDASGTSAWWDTASGELKLWDFNISLTGSYVTPDAALDVCVSGERAFVAAGTTGLLIFDISNPSSPTLAHIVNTPGSALAVAVAGNNCFVADFGSGLTVIRVSTTAPPAVIGSASTTGYTNDVCVDGNYAYLTDDWDGLFVFDISDPTSPSLMGSHNTPGITRGVCVSGDHVFVAAGAYGLRICTVRYPDTPGLLYYYDTPGIATDVCVAGDIAYVADGASGLQLIDISDPLAPVLAGSVATPGTATGVHVSGDWAYVADDVSGLSVFDVSNPAAPILRKVWDSPGTAKNVCVDGQRAFLADDAAGLKIIDVNQPVLPPVSVGTYVMPSTIDNVVIEGNLAFLAAQSGLRIIDISNPATPTLVGSYSPGGVDEVFVAGDYAYLTQTSLNFIIIDISNPASPSLVGQIPISASTFGFGLDVEGDLAYVGAGRYLRIINVNNPASPVIVGNFDTAGNIKAIDVQGQIAYVADADIGLITVRVSNPAIPVELDRYNTPGQCFDVVVSGAHAYIADWGNGLYVANVSNASSITHVASCATPDNSRGLAVSGDYAFMAATDSGLHMINISNPASPSLWASYDTPGSAYEVTVAGDHAYLAGYNQTGMLVFQVHQNEHDMYSRTGQSLTLNDEDETILAARFATSQTAGVTWEISADGGSNWQMIGTGFNWNKLVPTGNDLVWRSLHTWTPGINPSVDQVHVEWLYDKPMIVSSADIPNDQGGYVLLEWDPSGYDIFDEQTITHYSVWRAMNPVSASTQDGPETPLSGPEDISADFHGPAVRAEQGYYWEWLTNVTAYYLDGYAFAAPTYFDSTAGDTGMNYYQVIAHTADQWTYWTSHVDSGYSVDDLAPAVPQGFVVDYNTPEGNVLTWAECPDEDFQQFNIYRSGQPDFVPALDLLIGITTGITWTDDDFLADAGAVYYKVTAIDDAGNESPPAAPETVTGTGSGTAPATFALHQNVPNPFNPATTISYDVPPGGGVVTLRVYDVSGKLVRTLVDAVQPAGRKAVGWNGTDNAGKRVASGVYFYRMSAHGFAETRKMILLQ